MMWIVSLVYIVSISFIRAQEMDDRLEVICPTFEDNPFEVSRTLPRMRVAENEYCRCSINEHGSGKAAILKCDFNYEMDIVLKKTLFPFRNLNVTSTYVRMSNARSAYVTSEFLTEWMYAPSSAIDLWRCGKLVIEPTPDLHAAQHYALLRTFVGVGIIDCTMSNLPSRFLRDRSRGALRLKGCTVDKINSGIFHNIDEVRYITFEDTVVKEVAGPLSSTGVITLSKREVHSWDGIEVINSTFHHLAPYSFNVTHKDILEKFTVKKSTFGKVDKGAITIVGDLNTSVTNCSFENLDSLAIQVSVTGRLLFTNNVIEVYAPDSLLGLDCTHNSALVNNTFFVSRGQPDAEPSKFKDQCGVPKVFYVMKPSQQKSQGAPAASSVVAIIVLAVLIVAVGLLFLGWRNRSRIWYHYRRNDVPLWSEDREKAPDREDELPSVNHDGNGVNIIHDHRTRFGD